MNGLLAGLVASTACCAVIEPWASFVIGTLYFASLFALSHLSLSKGIVSSIVFLSFSSLLLHFQVDDPLDSAAIHLGAGAWGVS